MSDTIIYSNYDGQAPILWTILILFPIVAIVINLIPFIALLKRAKRIKGSTVVFANPLALIIMGIGFMSLLIVFGHDIIPCFMHGVISHGIGNIKNIVMFCRSA